MTNETLQEAIGATLLIVLAYPLAVLVFALQARAMHRLKFGTSTTRLISQAVLVATVSVR